MKKSKIIEILKTEKECIERQGTPNCPDRDCVNCDLLLPTEDVLKAYSETISLLDREECDDCVSREYLKQDMIRYGWKHPDTTVSEYVESLPSLQPKQKTGIWEKMALVYDVVKNSFIRMPYTSTDEKFGNSFGYQCTCGFLSNEPTNYCPSCGLKKTGVKKY